MRSKTLPGFRFQRMAETWHMAGRDPRYLIRGRKFLALYYWTGSPGGKKEGVSDVLAEYKAACRAGVSTAWIDDELEEKRYCPRCSYDFHFSNLALCTNCGAMFCHDCLFDDPLARNGNTRCPRCPAGEMVG